MDRRSETQRPNLTPAAFLALGTPQISYVRPVTVEGADRWGIFAANGTGLGLAATRDQAFAVARQHDLEPVSVH
ncbi:MAG: DUF1150 family protein [Alphaproteobacteria bacterium]|nr:DUF1150 family protein [Alphaproteobacteria bacterium]